MAIDWNKEAEQRERILFGLVLLMAFIVFFRFVHGPYSARLNETKGRISSLEMEKKTLLKFSQATPVVEGGVTLSKKSNVKTKILSGEVEAADGDIISLMSELMEPDFLGGVKVQKFSYQPEASSGGYSHSQFSVSLKGGFLDVMQYMERLEQFPALFYVDDLNLKSVEGRPSELEMEIQGRFFRINRFAQE